MTALAQSPGAMYGLATVAVLIVSYAAGSIPFAYLIVKAVTGEDITTHGTGNVGSMNVRRTTGSWGWFVGAVLGDGLKGLIPVLLAKAAMGGFGLLWLVTPVAASAGPFGYAGPARWFLLVPQAAVFGCVLGHNYSAWMALVERRFCRTGKGLATGAGALLAYDWRYLLAALVVALLVIAITRYMLAGQVAAAFALPLSALALRSPDWPFALVMGAVVYAAHHGRFVGLLQGKEPKLYINDRMGPRG